MIHGNEAWTISSYCTGGHCLGVRRDGDVVSVTNTSSTTNEALISFTQQQWHDFVSAAAAGEFDDLC
ncbi:MAG: DUF397 domain-containing protein [Acidimicrobiales bacterium]